MADNPFQKAYEDKAKFEEFAKRQPREKRALSRDAQAQRQAGIDYLARQEQRERAVNAAQRQIAQGAAGQEQFSEMPLSNRIAQGLLGGFANIPTAQNFASQIMGKRFLDMMESNPNAYPTFYNNRLTAMNTGGNYDVRTGYNPQEIIDQQIYDANNSGTAQMQQMVAPNPVTGACPAGYNYDAATQACVPMFTSQVPTQTAYETYTLPQTLLDQPSNILDFNPQFGTPINFNYSPNLVRRT